MGQPRRIKELIQEGLAGHLAASTLEKSSDSAKSRLLQPIPDPAIEIARRTAQAEAEGKCPGCWGIGWVTTPLVEERGGLHSKAIACPMCYDPPKTFANFNIKGNKDLKLALIAAKRWAEGEYLHLILVGPVGVGKTHLALAAAATMRARGEEPRVYKVAEMVERLRAGYDNKTHDAVFSEFTWSDPLVMDDMGQQRRTKDREGGNRISEFAIEQLELIVDRRLSNKAPTMFTTNLPREMLKAATSERLGSRVFSRIDGVHEVVIEAEDYRPRVEERGISDEAPH